MKREHDWRLGPNNRSSSGSFYTELLFNTGLKPLIGDLIHLGHKKIKLKERGHFVMTDFKLLKVRDLDEKSRLHQRRFLQRLRSIIIHFK